MAYVIVIRVVEPKATETIDPNECGPEGESCSISITNALHNITNALHDNT